jgi:hypothetical protein
VCVDRGGRSVADLYAARAGDPPCEREKSSGAASPLSSRSDPESPTWCCRVSPLLSDLLRRADLSRDEKHGALLAALPTLATRRSFRSGEKWPEISRERTSAG